MDSPAVDVLLIPVDSGVGLGKILSFRKPSCQARTMMKAKVAQASSEIEQSLFAGHSETAILVLRC
jgi:hypothetical protein